MKGSATAVVSTTCYSSSLLAPGLLPVPPSSPAGVRIRCLHGVTQAQVGWSRDNNILGFPTLPPLDRGEKIDSNLVLQVHSGLFAFVNTDTIFWGKKSSTFLSEKKAEVLFSFWTGNRNALVFLKAQNSKNSLNVLFYWFRSSEFIFCILLWYVNSTQSCFSSFIWSFLQSWNTYFNRFSF